MLAVLLLAAVASLVAWHYVGYPVALTAAHRIAGPPSEPAITAEAFEDGEWPPVSVVVIAHDEGDVIEDRIRNVLAADYPDEKLEVIVASDASTDDTVERARAVSPRVTAFDNTPHNKSETRNMAVERANHDVVLFTDADTRYESDCIRALVARYADADVGAVCGTLASEDFTAEGDAIGRSMGLYWRWEQYMKKLQGDLGLLVKGSGANLSVRRSSYEPVPDTADVDQVFGFATILGGKRSEFEPRAVAREEFPTDLRGELSTRRRLTIRSLTALWLYRAALDVARRPALAVHTASYWLLRYLMPYLLLGTFLLSGVLALTATGLVGLVAVAFFGLQVLFYALSIAGFVLVRHDVDVTPFSVPLSYCWANLGVLLGSLAFVSGERIYAYSSV